MKTRSFLSLSAAVLLLSIAITTDHPEKPTNHKLAPYDHFDFMRSFPELIPDYKAMDQAMQIAQATRFSASRSGGFDQEWQIEGPGNIGARINAIAVVEDQPDTIYIGYAEGGGVFRTYNGGQDWQPIFDDQTSLAIGSICINPHDGQTIYVGTGDRNIGGYFTTGNGVYKSTDGGDSWENIGLSEQKIISDLVVAPSDTSIIYAACMGSPSLADNNRGLYKTDDGGATWNQVLYLSDSAGVNNVLVHPGNADIVYASGWDRFRTNQFSNTSGEHGKIWKSVNGGSSWTQLTNGLPSGDQGRVGITMFTPDPDTLYALVVGTDSELEGIYRTFNGGASWTSIPTTSTGVSTSALGGFGWYFSGIYVNPYNYEDIFFEGVQLWRTQNSGLSWDLADPLWFLYEVHADKHDMHFLGPNEYLLATDGGLYRTVNSAQDWFKVENNKTNEFYRVEHSHHHPENYYGGMQDNGTSGGNASMSIWPRIYGGDGFQIRFHAFDNQLFYAETQNGNIVYSDDGGFNFNSCNFPDYANRTNWDTPYILSKHSGNVMYAGSHIVWKDDFSPFGVWSMISPDLTDGNIYGSAFHTISGIDESPLNASYLFACTSDGNVWRTLNGAASWDSIHVGLPNRYVTSVKASPSDENQLFVTHSGYKYNDFFAHIHKSTDLGDNWMDISGNMPPVAVNDIFIYPSHADSILFVATDAGVYGTIDAGINWERLGNNMPLIEVRDLELDTVHNRLVAATVGRSIMTYPLDSLVTIPIDTGTTSSIVVQMSTENQTCLNSHNGSIDLSVSGGTPPYTFLWSNGSTTQDLQALGSGQYTVTVTDFLGETASSQASVGYNPIHPDPVVGPISGPSQVQSWSTYSYSVPGTLGSVFEWHATGGNVSASAGNAASILWYAGPSASFEIIETNQHGCKSILTTPVDIKFVGIEDRSIPELRIYPNPSIGEIFIEAQGTLPMNLRIIDLHGAVVHEDKITKPKSKIDLHQLSSGQYILEFLSKQDKTSFPLMIQ